MSEPIDPNWIIRSMEIYCGPLCSRCGLNVPSSGGICEECEEESQYD